MRLDYRFSYLKTKSDLEVDLIIERPGAGPYVVELKSTTEVSEDDVSTLRQFLGDFEQAEFRIWSNDPHPKQFGPIRALPWSEGLSEIFPVRSAGSYGMTRSFDLPSLG